MKEFVVLYFFDYENKRIFYLRKHRPNKIEVVHNKLVGFGGKVEEQDKGDIYKTAIREIKEELGITLKKEDIFKQGILYEENDIKVHLMKTKMHPGLKEGPIDNEGEGIFLPFDYHKDHLDELPRGDEIFFDTFVYTDKPFEADVSKKPFTFKLL